MKETKETNEKILCREKIIEMVEKIENVDILNYIFVIISDIMIEEGGKNE